MIKNSIIVILFIVVIILLLNEREMKPVTFCKLTPDMEKNVSDFIDRGKGSELDRLCDCIYIQPYSNDSVVDYTHVFVSYLLPNTIPYVGLECRMVNGKRILLILNEFEDIATVDFMKPNPSTMDKLLNKFNLFREESPLDTLSQSRVKRLNITL